MVSLLALMLLGKGSQGTKENGSPHGARKVGRLLPGRGRAASRQGLEFQCIDTHGQPNTELRVAVTTKAIELWLIVPALKKSPGEDNAPAIPFHQKSFNPAVP